MGLRADDRAEPGRRRKLNKGIESLFRKYKVAVQVRGRQGRSRPTRSRSATRRSRPSRSWSPPASGPAPCPGAEFDGKTIISYKEAMSPAQAAEVDADHRRRPHRPRVRLLLQRDRHQGHARRADGPHPPRRGRGGLRGPAQEPDEARHRRSTRSRRPARSRRPPPGSRSTIETPEGPEDRRGRDDAGLHRRPRQRRGALRREAEGRARQEPHQGRPQERLPDDGPGHLRRRRRDRPPLARARGAPRGDQLHRAALRLRRPPGRLHEHPRLHLHRPRRRQRRPDREAPPARPATRSASAASPSRSAAGPWPPTRPRASSSSSSTPSTASCSAPTCSARRPPS